MKKLLQSRVAAILMFVLILSGIILTCVFLSLYFVKEPNIEYKMIGYAAADPEVNYEDYDLGKYTHLIFSFATVDTETGVPALSEENAAELTRFTKYVRAKSPETKIMFSVGGAGDDFTSAVLSSDRIAGFANGLKVIIDQYGLDGVDIDWEFPKVGLGGSQVKIFTELLRASRNAIGNKILSYAGTASLLEAGMYQNREIAKIVDFVNVMTYDMQITDIANYALTKNAMFYYYLSGYEKTQLNMGIPFYCRSADDKYNFNSYAQIKKMLDSGEAELHQLKYQSYAKVNGSRLSFDTPEMVSKKMNYVRVCGYGGAFCWQVFCDGGNELTDTMYNGLYK